MGGVSFISQFIGTVGGIAIALLGGLIVYKLVDMVMGLRLSEEEEFQGADLSIHKINSTSSEN